MVKTDRLAEILLQYGVPSYLVNRIITAILHERTYVQWNNRRTISPYLFILLLHHAISRVCARLNIDLGLFEILLPMILAYADDIIVLGESLTSIELILAALVIELQDIGLTINEKKSSIMLRDPNHCDSQLPPLVQMNGIPIQSVSVMKYLGVYVSSDLHHRGTVANRIQSAFKSFYTILPFVRANRLPLSTILRLYHTVIIPVVLFGLNVATLTKRNRQSLRRMELSMVRQLSTLARTPVEVDPTNISHVLGGHTVINKVRVRRLKYWGHIQRRTDGHILRKAMHYRIPGKLKHGRSCFTWNDSLRRDLQRTRNRNWDSTIMNTAAHNDKCNDVFNDPDTDCSDY